MRCTAAVTVNLDGEFFWLSRFPESAGKPKTLSMGTYGLLRGVWRVLDALRAQKLKATFFVPGAIAQRYPDEIRRIAQEGHELACRGYALENLALLEPDKQRSAIHRAADMLENLCGKRPSGFRAPGGEVTAETMRIAAQDGFAYSSSLYGDDMPYRTEYGGLVEIPIKWQLSDLPYFAFNYSPAMPAGQGRIASYAKVLENWQYEFEGACRYGLSYILQLDPQTIGTPGRIGLLEEMLGRMASGAQVMTCLELANNLV